LLGGIEAEAHRHDYSAIICNTDRNGRRTGEYLRVLSEKQVDGILCTSEFVTDEYEHLIDEMRIPIVLVSTMSTRYPIPYVRTDDRQAAYAATNYLIHHNHREICMVSGTEQDPIAGRPRVEGFLQALRDHGLDASESRVAYGDFHFASGRQAAAELLGEKPNTTAIFAASDEMAMGVLSEAWKRGIAVPGQLSVIGYDDTEDAQMAIPPLTCVRQPIGEMGALAVQMLLDFTSESRVLPFSITERESVRRIDT
jgi:LacI family transcriptional regulator